MRETMLTWKIIAFFVHDNIRYLPREPHKRDIFIHNLASVVWRPFVLHNLFSCFALKNTLYLRACYVYSCHYGCPLSLQCTAFLWFSNSLLTFLHVVKFHLTAFEWYGLFPISDHLPNPFEVKTKTFDSKH